MAWHPRCRHPRNRSMPVQRLSERHSISLLYHDIFDYPMKGWELDKWTPGVRLKLVKPRPRVEVNGGFFFLKGKNKTVQSRLVRKEESRKKMALLSRVKHVFENNKNILMVGITGSLAMSAARSQSDIDLIIITKKGRLWSSRLRILMLLARQKIAVRRAGERQEGDKLCLNIWMDESDLVINETNVYTAHELAQIVPLINRQNTHERLLAANKWILEYWPNAVQIQNLDFLPAQAGQNLGCTSKVKRLPFLLIEKIAYWAQRLYMSRKITRELVTPARAFFHPFDWSRKVRLELKKRGVVQALE